MENFLKQLWNRTRESTEAAEDGKLVNIYSEFEGGLFLGAGCKSNGQSHHAIFELHHRPANPELEGLFVAMAMALGYIPAQVMIDEGRMQHVLTAVQQYLPDFMNLQEYSLDSVAKIFLNISDALPCLCQIDGAEY